MATIDLFTYITEAINTGVSTPADVDGLQVAAWVASIRALTGTAPIVTNYPDYTGITFTADQKTILQGVIGSAMTPKTPGRLRVDLGPVIWPPVLKRLIPLLIGAGVLGYILHK